MDCPRCKLNLVREKYEGLDVDLCQSCWGVWLDSGELEAIVKNRQFQFSAEERELVLSGRAERGARPQASIACPKCGVRMERLYLDTKVHLVIDRCARHGVWLDTGEIKTVQAMAEASQKVSRLLLRKLKGAPGKPEAT
ncbi:MAG: zf-TFIIB domain-containing protein [Thermoanaerobaculia bacterium]